MSSFHLNLTDKVTSEYCITCTSHKHYFSNASVMSVKKRELGTDKSKPKTFFFFALSEKQLERKTCFSYISDVLCISSHFHRFFFWVGPVLPYYNVICNSNELSFVFYLNEECYQFQLCTKQSYGLHAEMLQHISHQNKQADENPYK